MYFSLNLSTWSLDEKTNTTPVSGTSNLKGLVFKLYSTSFLVI